MKYGPYDEIADKTLKEICGKIRLKWSQVRNIAIFYRLGPVAIKETNVVIAICSENDGIRSAAIELAINELQRTEPIWLNKIYDSDEESTLQNSPKTIINYKYSPLLFYF